MKKEGVVKKGGSVGSQSGWRQFCTRHVCLHSPLPPQNPRSYNHSLSFILLFYAESRPYPPRLRHPVSFAALSFRFRGKRGSVVVVGSEAVMGD